jgi:hypothetical protein
MNSRPGFHLERAEFEPFVECRAGRVLFANAMPDPAWPVFRRTPRRFRRRKPHGLSPRGQKVSRSIEKAGRVVEARRWMPLNPLLAHVMRVEDAWRARVYR